MSNMMHQSSHSLVDTPGSILPHQTASSTSNVDAGITLNPKDLYDGLSAESFISAKQHTEKKSNPIYSEFYISMKAILV